MLDQATPTVHLLDAGGAWLGNFGLAGEGPGELLRPVAIAVGHGTVAVADAGLGRINLYEPDGRYRDFRRIEAPGCQAARPVDVVAREMMLLLLVECISGRSVEHQVIAMGDGPLRLEVRRSPGAAIRPIFDFGATYVLSEHPRGFVFGDAQDDCLGVHDLDGAQLDRACHEWLPRTPLPVGKKRELERALERRGSSARFRMPDSFPPFDGVFWDDERLVYRVLQEEGSHLAARGGEGGAEAFGGVPAAPWLFVADGTALAAWDDFDGFRIALYPLR